MHIYNLIDKSTSDQCCGYITPKPIKFIQFSVVPNCSRIYEIESTLMKKNAAYFPYLFTDSF